MRQDNACLQTATAIHFAARVSTGEGPSLVRPRRHTPVRRLKRRTMPTGQSVPRSPIQSQSPAANIHSSNKTNDLRCLSPDPYRPGAFSYTTPPTHTLTYSHTHLLTHSPTHLLTHPRHLLQLFSISASQHLTVILSY